MENERKAYQYENGRWSGCRIGHVNVHGAGTLGGNDMVYRFRLADCCTPLFTDAGHVSGICPACMKAGAQVGKVYRVGNVKVGDKLEWRAAEVAQAEIDRLLAIPPWTEADGGLHREFPDA